MTATIGRNDPCPCGSGLKYKRCHAIKEKSIAKQTIWQRYPRAIMLTPVILCAGLLAAAVATNVGENEDRVWSKEHRHWHSRDGGELNGGGGGMPDLSRPAAQPPGPAPEGKVWSTEHGHWHDAATGRADSEAAPAPSGAEPAAESGAAVE